MPQYRKMISITVSPVTLTELFPFLQQELGLPRGRIIDYLVAKEAKKIKKNNAGATKSGAA